MNLQKFGTSILFADIPISPNRIEQRIGRLDRYGIGVAITIRLNLLLYHMMSLRFIESGWSVWIKVGTF